MYLVNHNVYKVGAFAKHTTGVQQLLERDELLD